MKTAKEKAKALELVEKFNKIEGTVKTGDGDIEIDLQYMDLAKQCALIAVDEIFNELEYLSDCSTIVSDKMDYWQQVKQEIENL